MTIATITVITVLIWNRRLQNKANQRTLDIAKLLQDYKNIAQALRKSQAQLNAVVNHLPLDLWVFDNSGYCVLQNTSATQRWGNQTHTHVSNLDLPDNFLSEFKEGQRSAMEGKQIEKELSLPTSETGSFLYKTAPVQSKQKIFGSVSINIDISELKATKAMLQRETSFSRLFMDNLPALFYLFNLEGKLLKWNANFERISNYNSNLLNSVSAHDLFNKADRMRIKQHISLLQQTGFAALEAHLQTCHGRSIPFYFTGTLITHAGETCILGCGIDISERKKAEHALSLSEERFRLAFESAPIGMALVNMNGQFIQTNSQLTDILGYDQKSFLTLKLADIEIGSKIGFNAPTEGRLSSKAFNTEKKLQHQEGHIVWVQYSSVLIHDSGNNSHYHVVQIADITERKQLLAKLHTLAYHDSLTGLPNRKLFTEFLSKALKKAARTPNQLIALIFIDLDRFKRVNDSLGHLAGDQLLIGVAKRLQAELRPADIIARFAGDEFVVLLDTVSDQKEPVELAERLQKSLEKPFDIDGHALTCPASMGISVKPAGYSSAEVLLRDADTAMYRAKTNGRGCAVMFDHSMHTQARSDLDIENRLRAAFENRTLKIYYQPIVSMETGKVVSVETLTRWPDPKDSSKVRLPGEYLHIAEETGLLEEMDRWVLESSVKQLSQWQKTLRWSGKPLGLSVNFSSRHLLADDFIDFLQSLLQRYQIAPKSLNIEITESSKLDDSKKTHETLSALRALDVNIHLDDFGTGYSALGYLYKFPIDALEIDKSFINRMLKSEKHLAIVRSIILLAKTQNIKVTAEGIESQKQYDQLQSMGCANAQGYLISKPIPIEKVNTLLNTKPKVIEEASAVI